MRTHRGRGCFCSSTSAGNGGRGNGVASDKIRGHGSFMVTQSLTEEEVLKCSLDTFTGSDQDPGPKPASHLVHEKQGFFPFTARLAAASDPQWI